ncbi:type VII secretion protein EccB [Amycolatopsis sp. CA-230715]|uniref:type VII secretion protein EccB n=1 Tax=Amycolatopsis sp. CA-230715 TaxID=2745196 RepID=UPI001C343320|nr:type VII secretion protein EccB [Amycolatopsis sp. CA-230715]QWF78117.1 ESX-5 secretion system ATPase EccB5 [Amycolatopsis sp. CA-230715]
MILRELIEGDTGGVWTQRDQIQAYQFLRRRLVSALVAADANHPVSPSRRLVLGTAAGLAVAVLVTAVCGVLGLLSPGGGKDWLSGGHVIVEEGTGARFVLGQDGVLHPVLNYSSARLLAGAAPNADVTVPAKKLATAARGAGIGIVGAPDSLPAPERLVTTAWTNCSRTSRDAPSSADPTSSVLLVAGDSGRVLGPREGLLVRLPDGSRYLISAGHRFRLTDEALVALHYDQRMPIAVSPRWLGTVPAGRDLAFLEADGAGERGPSVGGKATKTGQVLRVGEDGYYLVRADGLEAITETQAALVPGGPEPADVAAVARAPKHAGKQTAGGEDAAGYPGRIPVPVTVTGTSVTVCARDGDARVTISDRLPLPGGARPIATMAKQDGRVADEVSVPPSGGAVVAEQTAPGVDSGTTYLVTDTGVKYPVVSREALAALGYGAVPRQPVAAGTLAALPSGPALDPAAAAVPVTGAGSG